MEIRNVTEIDLRALRALAAIPLRRIRGLILFCLALTAIVHVACIAILLLRRLPAFADLTTGDVLILAVLLDVLFLFLFLGTSRVIPALQYRTIQRRGGCRIEYIFYEDSFALRTQNEVSTENCTAMYAFLCKIVETEEYFFLYPNRSIAYIVCKSGTNPSEIDRLQNTLRSCKVRYFNYAISR